MFWDASRALAEFAPPPYFAISGGEAVASISSDTDDRWWTAACEVECGCYLLAVPNGIRRKFGLPPVMTALLPRWRREHTDVKAGGDLAHFRWAVWASAQVVGGLAHSMVRADPFEHE